MMRRLLTTLAHSLVTGSACAVIAHLITRSGVTEGWVHFWDVVAGILGAGVASTLSASALLPEPLPSRDRIYPPHRLLTEPWVLAAAAYNASNFGRMFGWWILHSGRRVACLDYLYWETDSQFWHRYRLAILDESVATDLRDANRWCKADIALESRFISGYLVKGTLISVKGPDQISLRFAHVDESVFDDPAFDIDTFSMRGGEEAAA